MMHYPRLLSPLEIGPLRLSNRIVFPPMVISMARDDGLAGQAHVDHYRGVEGPGLVIVEGVAVSREGRINRRQLTIDTDHHIDGLARLARVIHENGSVAGIQLHHAGATALSETRKWKYVRVTRILARLAAQQLWIGHLRQIRRPFVEGARRAVEAGFDLIEVHGAHGYLFTQFLSPIKNWRIDGHGGSIENRSRLLLEVISDVDAAVGKSAVVTCRLGVADGRRGGLSVSDGISVAVALEKSGMRVLDVSSGSGTPANVRPVDSPFSARLHLAKLVKSAVSIPVIGNMGIRHPQMAEEALEAGMADLIAVGKGILADPLWARKVIDGNPESILECRECRPCFFHSNGLKCPTRKKMVVSNQRSDT